MPVMAIYRVFGDEMGETHLSRVELPPADESSPRALSIRDIPATTCTVTELLERKPDNGLHVPPRRQLVVVLRGALEITTTSGECQRLEPGDCLLADDLDARGHATRQVGDGDLSTITVGIAPEWRAPD